MIKLDKIIGNELDMYDFNLIHNSLNIKNRDAFVKEFIADSKKPVSIN